MYETESPRGEYVLVIAGKDRTLLAEEEKKKWEEMTVSEHVAFYEEQDIDRKEAMKRVAADRGISKREVYDYLLKNSD